MDHASWNLWIWKEIDGAENYMRLELTNGAQFFIVSVKDTCIVEEWAPIQ